MSLFLATANDSGPSFGAWLLLAVVFGGSYLVHCLIWPFRACSKCGGGGRFRSSSGRAWRYCDKCGGRAAEVRPGRRLVTYLTKTRHRGDR
ncbi:hypothetical protein GCM10023085_50490 [Actinomadura viridis]|uniref:Uncharacterized protein n=1 Tax=Actinomadura viridis TaxID=58110 RepID=A0A931DJK1_9ACTN|nr:hypothetical protein [Actinomadura viridis]MBG6092369.1 hypothetical protein [Actinomadura viridis]